MERDILEKLLLEMSDQYPELSRVFIDERDEYLAYSLRKCAQPIPIETNSTGFIPSTVVAVVGIGHVKGIVQQWNQPTIQDVQHLLQMYSLLFSTQTKKEKRKSFFFFRSNDEKAKSPSNFSSYGSFSIELACFGLVIGGLIQLARYRLR